MKNNKGLTLVELLGVLVVLGIIVGIVVPSITKNLKSSQVELCYHQIDSLKAAAANFVMGKAEDHRKTVINAKIADFIALFIVYLHDMLIITKNEKKCKRDCGILEKSMKQGVHHEKI